MTNRARLSPRTLLCALALPLLMTGCADDVDALFHVHHVNLLEIDYDAADVLAHQAKGMLPPGTPIRVGILKDAYAPVLPPPEQRTTIVTSTRHDTTITRTPLPDETEPPVIAEPEQPMTTVYSSAPFGRVTLEQIGGRWVDLGFNIIGGASRPRRGEALLTGQYARTGSRVLVNLRLVDVGSGRVLAAYDYSVPISGEVGDLLRTDGHTGFLGTNMAF